VTITYAACGHPVSTLLDSPKVGTARMNLGCRLCRLFKLVADDAYVVRDLALNLEFVPRVYPSWRREWAGREDEANACDGMAVGSMAFGSLDRWRPYMQDLPQAIAVAVAEGSMRASASVFGEAEPLILGVDTSAGVGLDAQAMALVGHRSGKVHRTFKNNLLPIPQYIRLALETVERWSPVAVLVESNAVGEAVWAALQGVRGAEEQRSGNRTGEVQERRDRLRDDVEAGLAEGSMRASASVFGYELVEVPSFVFEHAGHTSREVDDTIARICPPESRRAPA
jgi:hypothetical protein